MQRRDLLKPGLALAASPCIARPASQTLRIGMTTFGLPTTGGIPDNGSKRSASSATRSMTRW